MSDAPPQLVLASASPRRRELLEQIGVRFVVRAAEIDERRLPDESPEQTVCRLAAEKSVDRLAGAPSGIPVLAADTIVVLDDEILGKPADAEQGIAMLTRLSGREHRVLSAVSLRAEDHWQSISETRVWFRELEPSEMAAYWRTGEPCDKAGCYAIQGLGGLFVRRIEGSYSGVVGLPIYETAELLNKAGIPLLKE
ncbi:MAG: Maf family nucleotide pyrophosphatase [Methylococcaceae bacterium]|nr:Maf family nucleotide pyrophosphatase [Methylococcaceae bacterium]